MRNRDFPVGARVHFYWSDVIACGQVVAQSAGFTAVRRCGGEVLHFYADRDNLWSQMADSEPEALPVDPPRSWGRFTTDLVAVLLIAALALWFVGVLKP